MEAGCRSPSPSRRPRPARTSNDASAARRRPFGRSKDSSRRGQRVQGWNGRAGTVLGSRFKGSATRISVPNRRPLRSESLDIELELTEHSWPSVGLHRGAEETRTPDFLLAKEALYQLSYGPKSGYAGFGAAASSRASASERASDAGWAPRGEAALSVAP